MEKEIDRLQSVLKELYGEGEVLPRQIERYQQLLRTYRQHFGAGEVRFFSSPGRTEIGGNHTDHNHGRVLAASVNLDAIAVAGRTDDGRIVVYSEGYSRPFEIDLGDLKIVPEEQGSTTALIRGIAYRLEQLGYRIGGFRACLTSDVLPGSGLSSSAAIEVLIGTIFNVLYNRNRIDARTLAKIGQYAENIFFGKPCGLMDQMAAAVGGIITIDFRNPESPLVEKVDFDMQAQGYSLLVVNTGGNHEDLTSDYAAVPAEMKAVALELGKAVCREITFEEFLEHLPRLRRKLGDRAVLRAYHFLQENERVVQQVQALRNGNFRHFLQLVRASGDSSFKWLQNIFTPRNVREQGITLALALTEEYLQRIGEGACRVHGGGFAGTILVFLPDRAVADYQARMESVFGKNSVLRLQFRPQGAICLNTWPG